MYRTCPCSQPRDQSTCRLSVCLSVRVCVARVNGALEIRLNSSGATAAPSPRYPWQTKDYRPAFCMAGAARFLLF